MHCICVYAYLCARACIYGKLTFPIIPSPSPTTPTPTLHTHKLGLETIICGLTNRNSLTVGSLFLKRGDHSAKKNRTNVTCNMSRLMRKPTT